MRAQIAELVGKSKKRFSMYVESDNEKEILSFQASGKSVWDDLSETIISNKRLLSQVTNIHLYNKHHSPFYIDKFTNLEELHIIGSGILDFPNLTTLRRLTKISINQQSKPPNLSNLKLVPNLQILEIGTFPPIRPVVINNIDDLSGCHSLESLILGNVKFTNNDVRKISSMKYLKDISLPQNIDVDTLAYLTVHLKNTKSEELGPWQKLIHPWAGKDIKINGKRRPFLSSITDKSKIEKYEDDFSKLVDKYTV